LWYHSGHGSKPNMARRAGKTYLCVSGQREHACRSFEQDDLKPEEQVLVRLLNLGLLKSLIAGPSRSFLEPATACVSGSFPEPTKRDVATEQEGQTPDDLLTELHGVD